MFRTVLVLILTSLLTAPVFAGPNSGGTLILHDCGLFYYDTDPDACQSGTDPASCTEADPEVEYATGGGWCALIRVYAAFPATSNPRMMGVSWGVHYNAGLLWFLGYRACADFELSDAGWPGPDTGTSVTWNAAQTGHLVPLYGFFAETYSRPATVTLIAHPTYGGWFGDDSVPAILDPIAGYGTLGFDTPGVLICPDDIPTGACCAPEGTCLLTIEVECHPPDVWHGEWTSCEPNPCPPPTPVDRVSWGRMKRRFR